MTYNEIMLAIVESMWRDPDNLEVGENISDIPEVKIIFDGYGDLETEDENGQYQYVEGGNTDMESYAIFIHKDSGQENFEFPEHEFSPWGLLHRTNEEVCIYAWYDVANNEWSINDLCETSDHKMTDEEVMNILQILADRYFKQDETD